MRCAQQGTVIILVAAMSTALGCGGASYDSPQSVFTAFKTAVEKEDWEGLCNCLTPEGLDQMAGSMMFAGVMMQGMGQFAAMGDEDAKKKMDSTMKEIESTLKKHGVTEESMAKLEPDTSGPPDMGALSAPIKNKAAFVGDMMRVLNKMDQEGASNQLDVMKESTLEDVTIDGDSATGTIVSGDMRNPISFKKIDGSWKVSLDMGGPN